jgi:diadenosine tetraphosphatase ApaH/serine/threonine PP2A family protein phosphatase
MRCDFLNKLRVRVVERVGPNGAEPLNGTANGVKPGHHLLAVHGSPRRPINEYIFPDDAINATDKLESIFDRITKLAIVGHTHVPGVFTNEPDFYPPSELGENGYKFQEDEKAIINVGSVGQPRDFDPRASYVILHPTHAQFVRLEYDVKATAEKIKSIPELGGWLGDRLYEGR